MFLKGAPVALVKCQIDSPHPLEGTLLWQSVGALTTMVSVGWKDSRFLPAGERQCSAWSYLSDCSPLFVSLPCEASLSSGLATGPESTNMLTSAKSSWLPLPWLLPDAQGHGMELECGQAPNEATVVCTPVSMTCPSPGWLGFRTETALSVCSELVLDTNFVI